MKGIILTDLNSPAIPAAVRRHLAPEEQQQFIDEWNKRWAIVDKCEECGEGLIEEERAAHRLAHAEPGNVRVVARMLFDLPPAQRIKAMRPFCPRCGAFAEVGEIHNH